MAHRKSIENQIKRRKWNFVGHTLRKETGAIEKTALDWIPQGYRRRGRPKRMWGRTEDEMRGRRRSWNEVKRIAGDRSAWKLFMDVLCSTRGSWNEVKEIAGDHSDWKIFMDALCSTRNKRI